MGEGLKRAFAAARATQGKHPGRTPAQRRVLDEIGCGNNSPMMSHATRNALLANGDIVRISDKVLSDNIGKFTISQYEMSIPTHMQWCEFCSKEMEAEK